MTERTPEEKLEYRLVKALTLQTPVVLMGNLFLAVINAALFWERLEHLYLYAWSISLLAVGLLRWLSASAFHHYNQKLSLSQWQHFFAATSFLQGLAWCLLCIYASTILDFTGITVIVITLAGLTAGAVASTSSSVYSFLCFSVPTLLPIGFILIGNQESEIRTVGFLICLFFVLTLRQVITINSLLRESYGSSIELEKSKNRSEQLSNELYKLSTMDALTLVANRRGFDEALDREWLRAKRTSSEITLIMIDVDYFKSFNDSFGHQMGDECLKKIATELTMHARRAGDLVARYGGEEFAIILPNMNEKEGLVIGQNACDGIANLNIRHPSSQTAKVITVSVGVYSLTPNQLKDSRQLIRHADHALYKAKANGRNRVENGTY
ncbi:MAG: diguanylate cyclase (GGDEF)-like protein [Oceanicoccus sp.]|jgi:diguanylate cyclase (GGDEF)-like protein